MSSALKIETIEVSLFQQNARILYNEGSKHAVVVDPGAEAERIAAFLDAKLLIPQAVWLTHSHLDHCGAVTPFLGRFPIPLFAHPNEKEMRANVVAIAARYGISPEQFFDCPEPSDEIVGGETLMLDGIPFEVLFIPGHSPGHLCFYQKDSGVLIAGDTLFAGSVGRTDLPGGSHQLLMQGIREKIFTLPDDTTIMPGHGPDTTVGHEKRTNPFFV